MPLTLVKRIQNINSKEASLGISEDASWHAKYKDSAYVYVGGIPFDLTEGDLLAVFAQLVCCCPDSLTTGLTGMGTGMMAPKMLLAYSGLELRELQTQVGALKMLKMKNEITELEVPQEDQPHQIECQTRGCMTDSRSSKIEKDSDRKRTEMHSSDRRSKLDKGDEDSRGYWGKPPRYDSGKTHQEDDDRREEKRSKHESESYRRDYKESDRRSSREESYGRENQESDRRSSRSGESASRD
ncbi:zinc finger CCCH domain-containing protein 25-like protein [Tanacetum coccineum]